MGFFGFGPKEETQLPLTQTDINFLAAAQGLYDRALQHGMVDAPREDRGTVVKGCSGFGGPAGDTIGSTIHMVAGENDRFIGGSFVILRKLSALGPNIYSSLSVEAYSDTPIHELADAYLEIDTATKQCIPRKDLLPAELSQADYEKLINQEIVPYINQVLISHDVPEPFGMLQTILADSAGS